MSRFGVSDHLISMHDCILCYFCETRVAFIEDFIPNADDLVYGGYINRLFHYSAPINHQGHLERRDGNTLLNIYCVQCQMWFGWRLDYPAVGVFCSRKILYETLRDAVFGVANEQAPNGGANAAPNGGANAVQNGVANEQDPNGGANAVQNGVANEQAPNGGTNAVQNGVANEQAPNGGANAVQNGVANEQAPNGGANAVQNRVANEQAPNGGANAVQNGVANEQAPNGGANAVQNGVADEQNRGQHRAGIVRPRRLRPRWNRQY
ncbi:hypothetical protein H5410_034333 [Solanum commersonii]|uniref:Yippee domain-containing protein n=1 Tax=Solanum commersonii TaxID=4109 RepID=A0A9J5YQD8_SOLCO|nr:hypothetical protein H5410_034333 [Solanum commersonii]